MISVKYGLNLSNNMRMLRGIVIAASFILTLKAYQEPVFHVYGHEDAIAIEQLHDSLYELYIRSFHEIYREYWSEEFADFMQKAFDKYFKKLILTDAMTLVVATRDQDICGWILVDHKRESTRVIIELICVDSHVKRQGIGKRLIYAIRELFPEVTSVAVATMKFNTVARPFYESLGFIETDFMLPEYDPKRKQGYEWFLNKT